MTMTITLYMRSRQNVIGKSERTGSHVLRVVNIIIKLICKLRNLAVDHEKNFPSCVTLSWV